MKTYNSHYINGQWVAAQSKQVFEVHDSSTEEVFATVPQGTRAEAEQAVLAATAGGAAALRRTDVGRIAAGARADFIVLDAPSSVHLAYRPGVSLVHQTWRNGALVASRDQS